MRSLLILALLAAPAAATAQKAKIMKLQDEKCVALGDRVGGWKKRAKPGAGPHKLGEMPPARSYYTVYREANGCPVLAAVGDEARKR